MRSLHIAGMIAIMCRLTHREPRDMRSLHIAGMIAIMRRLTHREP
jgi:hypothetical protein